MRYELSGSGTVSSSLPINVVGSLSSSTASTQSLPIELQDGIAPAVSAPGTLRVTDLNTGNTTTSTVYGGWTFAYSGVTLGTDYSLTKTRPCQ